MDRSLSDDQCVVHPDLGTLQVSFEGIVPDDVTARPWTGR